MNCTGNTCVVTDCLNLTVVFPGKNGVHVYVKLNDGIADWATLGEVDNRTYQNQLTSLAVLKNTYDLLIKVGPTNYIADALNCTGSSAVYILGAILPNPNPITLSFGYGSATNKRFLYNPDRSVQPALIHYWNGGDGCGLPGDVDWVGPSLMTAVGTVTAPYSAQIGYFNLRMGVCSTIPGTQSFAVENKSGAVEVMDLTLGSDPSLSGKKMAWIVSTTEGSGTADLI